MADEEKKKKEKKPNLFLIRTACIFWFMGMMLCLTVALYTFQSSDVNSADFLAAPIGAALAVWTGYRGEKAAKKGWEIFK